MAKRPATRRSAPREVEIGRDEGSEEVLRAPAPVPLRSIIGQGRAVEILQNALRSGRVHHAWIFHGPAGVGKFTTALAFAATLLDPESRAAKDGFVEPPGGSAVQQLLRMGTHPDLRIIVKELASFSSDARVRAGKQRVIPKAVIDEFLVDPATRSGLGAEASARGMAGKVFIVDEAELMEPPSQNVLLKTLEEPPPGTVIILVTSAEDLLLPTIRSRAQRVAFPPLSEKDMEAWLKSGGPEVSREQRAWLLSHAAGSPGALAEALEYGLFEWHRQLEPMLGAVAEGEFMPALGSTMAELAERWAKAWVERHPGASKDAANKQGADRVLAMVGGFFRARLRERPDGVRLRCVDLVHEAGVQADANVNLGLVFSNLAAQLLDVQSSPARLTPAR